MSAQYSFIKPSNFYLFFVASVFRVEWAIQTGLSSIMHGMPKHNFPTGLNPNNGNVAKLVIAVLTSY